MAVSESVIGWGVVLAISSVTAAAIVNSVAGNYDDSKGHAYGTSSNVASVSIASIAGAMVVPKQAAADPVADAATSGTVATRTFTITNDSNISDAYIISAVTVSGGAVQSVSFTPSGSAPIPAEVGKTISPTRQPQGSLTVAVAVSTVGAAVGSSISVALTAKTTAPATNGSQSDTGKTWVYVARGPQITGVVPGTSTPPPNDKSALVPVTALVNGASSAQAAAGTTLSFEVPFTNIGDAPAFGVVVTDPIPALLHPVPGSVTIASINRRTGKSAPAALGDARVSLTDGTITATIPRLDAGAAMTISFQASTSASVPVGTTIENSASVTAQSLAKIVAVPAVVFVGVMDTVYDAIAGSAHPIAGAAVSLADPVSGLPAKLAAAGDTLNKSNANPFSTSSSGVFSFTLNPATSRESDYDLYVTATGYLNRKIKVATLRDPGGLPSTTLTALDGLPLATAGGFSLTSGPVTVTGVPGFFGNVPLISPQALSLALTVDRTVASAGDRLAYSADFGPGKGPLAFPAELTISLPPGVAYAHGTARIGATPIEPVAAARTLAWPLASLTEHRILTFYAAVLPGVTEGATARTLAHLTVRLPGASLGADAGVDVAIVGGPLSSRSILTGRVFANHAGDGHFAPGDLGLAGVRIFLEDGESVQTDHDGRFSFPAARPGMHVLHLDPLTLPPGMSPYRGFPANDPRNIVRLVHGIFDSGLMSDVNFAISAGPGG